MKKSITILTIFIVVVGAFVFWNKHKALAPSSDYLKNSNSLSYKDLTYDIDGVPISFKDGTNEQKVPGSVTTTTTSYFGNEARGDFNGDGKEDVAFLLVQDGGGTGLFYFLAVALGNGKGYDPLNTIFIGDRIAPQNTTFKDGKIIANYVDRLPTDPMTAEPTIGVSRYFEVRSRKLVEIKGEFGN